MDGETKENIAFNKVLYTYKGREEYFQIEKHLKDKDIIFYTLSSWTYTEELVDMIKYDSKSVVDISLLGYQLTKDNSIIGYLSAFLEKTQTTYIVKDELKDVILDKCYFFFKEAESADQLFSEIDFVKIKNTELNKTTNLFLSPTILEKGKKEAVFNSLDENLFGQHDFKKFFKSKIESFILKNKIGRNKVFSIFLLGSSGLGKTEVARIINKSLEPDYKRIVRINFGNYSSEHSLSSLIGSPRGYHGSEEGELIVKMKKAHGGVLLCDEFEKAHKNVILFFLDLLENGNFSDSLGNEWDLNGYIIVFTSNISKEAFQKLPSEFISRLDLVCNFSNIGEEDKKNYINFVVDDLKNDIEKSGLEFPNSQNFDIQKFISIEDLRKIKRDVEDEILGNVLIQTTTVSHSSKN